MLVNINTNIPGVNQVLIQNSNQTFNLPINAVTVTENDKILVIGEPPRTDINVTFEAEMVETATLPFPVGVVAQFPATFDISTIVDSPVTIEMQGRRAQKIYVG